jgi:hypothetical protein
MEKLKWTIDGSFNQFRRSTLIAMLFWENVKNHTVSCGFYNARIHSDGRISCVWVDRSRWPTVQNIVFLTASQEATMRTLNAI